MGVTKIVSYKMPRVRKENKEDKRITIDRKNGTEPFFWLGVA